MTRVGINQPRCAMRNRYLESGPISRQSSARCKAWSRHGASFVKLQGANIGGGGVVGLLALLLPADLNA
eukprot:1523257-Amphidinium_carterae.1